MTVYGVFEHEVARTDDDNIIAIFTTKEKAEEYIKKYEPSYEGWTVIALNVEE